MDNTELSKQILKTIRPDEVTNIEEARLLSTKATRPVKKVMGEVEQMNAEDLESLLFSLTIYTADQLESLEDMGGGNEGAMRMTFKHLQSAAQAWKKRKGN